jgi:hypothetical protein
MPGPSGKVTCLMMALLAPLAQEATAELLVGTASTDITPDEPVALCGQFHLRVSTSVESPVTANVVVLESVADGQPQDAAIMVSCDLVYIPEEVLALLRKEVSERLPDLDATKIVLNGTHTHTAPVLIPGKYPVPEEGVVQVEEYV